MIKLTVPASFSQRLKLLLGSRKMTPWATALQIPSGTMTRMFKGEGIPPTYETLTRIMRTENASLSWLLGGDCAPFLVSHTIDDADTADLLRAHLDDLARWQVVVLGGGGRRAILLHDNAQLDHPNGAIHYTVIAVLSGPIGPLTLQALHSLQPAPLTTRNIGRAAMHDLHAGNLGTYRLIGDPARRGLIEPAHTYSEDIGPLDVVPTAHLAETRAEYTAAMPQRFAQAWPQLRDSERDTMTRLLGPFLNHISNREEDPAD